jgi:fructose-1-phosphate kinase PfkB-like protein
MEIITLTGNLLAEWTFSLPAFERGETHRADAMGFQVGGKGINVSRILKRLGSETLAMGFAGGKLADFCSAWLEQQQIAYKFFPLEEGVRPGLVVREAEHPGEETTFLGSDLAVPVAAWKAACQFAGQSRPHWLAICGSIPGWNGSWSRAVASVMDSKVRIAVDTYGPPLEALVKLPLDLVKINRTELDRLFPGKESEPTVDVITGVKKSSPVRNWIITDGPRAIICVIEAGTTLTLTPAPIKEISPTGSGDTFLAALLNKWPEGGDLREALAFAGACATASAASPGIGDFPLPLPERFTPEIKG